MLVILRETVQNLGRVGDVIKVSDGYARNFLLPRKLVVAAAEGNIKAIEHHKKQLEKKRAAEKLAAEDQKKKLEAITCEIKRKVGEGSKLFGSVSTTDIASALKTIGHTVEKRMLHLSSPIRTLGSFEVEVKLTTEVTATLKVLVSKEA